MDMKSLVGVMMAVAILSVGSVTAHYPPGICIRRCLAECNLSGVDAAVCIKYCPVHCLPQETSTKGHFCNLGCMLDSCAQFSNDDQSMSDCVTKCNKSQCKIDV